jgi:hypothetical protein
MGPDQSYGLMNFSEDDDATEFSNMDEIIADAQRRRLTAPEALEEHLRTHPEHRDLEVWDNEVLRAETIEDVERADAPPRSSRLAIGALVLVFLLLAVGFVAWDKIEAAVDKRPAPPVPAAAR